MKNFFLISVLLLAGFSQSHAQFWAKSNGRFGIGDENAYAKLQVNALSSFANPGIALLDSSATNTSGGILQFRSRNWINNHFNIQAKIGEYAYGQDSKLDFFFRDNLIMSIEGGSNPDRQLIYNPREGIFRTGYLNPGARGEYSLAMGYNNLAAGFYSVALGIGNQAVHEGCIALGGNSIAESTYSTAIGYYNYASGPFSLAAGINSTAGGFNAVAIGDSAVATGSSSHAIGHKTLASALSATATGHQTDATGLYSFSSGYNTKATNTSSSSFGFYTQATGVSASSFGYSTVAAGENSIALNSESEAYGNNALSSGYATKAYGWESSAFGNNTTTRSYVSAVFGAYNDTIATSVPDGWVSTDPLLMVGNGVSNAERNNAFTIYKNGSILAKNSSTVNSDPGSLPVPVSGAGTRMMWIPEKSAFRVGTVFADQWDAGNIGTGSFVAGINSKATGWHSMVIGGGNIASGTSSTAIGYLNESSGYISTAMGSLTKASGDISTSLGQSTQALGYMSVATGDSTKTSGIASFSMGTNTEASGDFSIAMGQETKSSAYASVAIGRYNDTVSGVWPNSWIEIDPILMVGNGTSETSRHNAFSIYKNGNLMARNPTTVSTNPLYYVALPASGSGTRMMWIPEKSAFRAGTVAGEQWNPENIGTWSFAAGANTEASGAVSVAMGNNTIASGGSSTAFGLVAKATGDVSLATGNYTEASGINSTAMGFYSKATGDYATTIGLETRAKSYAALAIGSYNDSISSSTNGTWISTDPLFMIGNGTSETTRHNALTIYKNGNLLAKHPTTVTTDPFTLPVPVSGEGTRLMWLPEKSAFRVGTVQDDEWDASNIGTWSFASGKNTEASGNSSTALGNSATASGGVSIALGNFTTASGSISTAFGHSTTASALHSTAFGTNTLASGEGATSMGFSTVASGYYSTALGYNTNATIAYSTAMGINTTASGSASIAMGSSTEASGDNSTAMGSNTEASGEYSTAMGILTEASGDRSTAMGIYTLAKAYASTAIGRYNDEIATSSETSWVDTDPIFYIGNGSISEFSNAMVVYKNGNTDINGYTRLGEEAESAPRIKMKELPLSVAGVNYNSFVSIPHGLTVSKILSVSVLIEWVDNNWAPPEYSPSLNLRYNYYINATDIVVQNNTPSGDCLICERPVKVTITYKE